MMGLQRVGNRAFKLGTPNRELTRLRAGGIQRLPRVSEPLRRPTPEGCEDGLDIVLPLGSGSLCKNLELRFALRSIERYATGWRKIVVVGENPGFLRETCDRIEFVPMQEQGRNHESRIASKLFRALSLPSLTPWVMLWNDDYILCDRIDLRQVQLYRKGSLSDRKLRSTANPYGQAVQLTLHTLEASGLPAFNYDGHVPMPFNRAAFVAMEAWWKFSDQTRCGLVVKSCYANQVLEEPGPLMSDLKFKTYDGATMGSALAGRWIYSYGDGAFSSGLANRLATQFPEKSRFEE